jgi:hypothetical protein
LKRRRKARGIREIGEKEGAGRGRTRIMIIEGVR